MNCDSAVTLGDVGGFTGVLLAPEQASDCQEYLTDVTGDGDVDGRDVQHFIAATEN